MNTEKEKIISFCTRKFLAEGFIKITMDEIASEMKMSKKTIYKNFNSKDEIVAQVIESFTLAVGEKIDEIVSGNFDSLTKVLKIGEVILETVLRTSDKWMSDLNSADRKFWQQVEDFRTKTILKNFNIIITQGKKEGLIIDEPTILLITILISAIRSTVNPEFIVNNNLSAQEAGRKTLNILIMGILTKKGRKVFKKYISGKQNENESHDSNSFNFFADF